MTSGPAGFPPSWLALREPADDAARAPALVDELRLEAVRRSAAASSRDVGTRGEALLRTAAPTPSGPAGQGDALLHVVDLGAGTGANLRYLAPRLGGRQRWTLVDVDVGLLERVAAATAAYDAETAVTVAPPPPAAPPSAFPGDVAARSRVSPPFPLPSLRMRGAGFECEVSCVALDLCASLDAFVLPPGCLVTAAALLDLVSREWLQALAARCARASAAVLFALTYDGRIELGPAEPGDDLVRGLVNLHQRGDKGFGPALGPAAADAAIGMLRGLGYRVTATSSDWRLARADAPLQRELVEGWAAAAREAQPERAGDVERWRARRLEHVDARRSELLVGHTDVAGLPPGA